jgi:hypothetical protein
VSIASVPLPPEELAELLAHSEKEVKALLFP